MLSTYPNRMATLFSNPFEAVFREFGRDFNGESGHGSVTPGEYPGLALWSDDAHVYLELDVPGICKEDLELTVENGKLWIRGERKRPENVRDAHHDERRYGKFERVIALSDVIDPESIDARLADGVLFIELSKKSEHQPHRVAIKYDDVRKLDDQGTKT